MSGTARSSADDGTSPAVEASGGAVLVHLKVVPGASRTRIVGLHGSRVKVTVAAAPERGRANREVQRLLAKTLGVRAQAVEIVRGVSDPRKTARVSGVSAADAEELLLG